MKRIEKFIILLVFLEILVGCSSLSNIGEGFAFGNYSIPNTNLTVYVDLSNEEWDQYSYIPTNLFEYNGSIYFKERYRLYKVDGMTAELCWKDYGVNNFIKFNDNIYWWISNYIPSSRSKMSSFDEIFLYNINSHDSKSDGTINDKLNKFNRDLEGFDGNSILPSHWYGECFYYAKTDENNDLVSIFEYNTETDNIRTIKNNISSLDEFKIFHTADNIVVCHFPSCQYYKNSKVKLSIEVLSRKDLTVVVPSKNFEYTIGNPNEDIDYYSQYLYKDFLTHFDKNIYIFGVDTIQNIIDVQIYNIETGAVSVEKYEYELKDTSSYGVEVVQFLSYDDKYYYIIDECKLSRIDRTTGLVELVFEVVE